MEVLAIIGIVVLGAALVLVAADLLRRARVGWRQAQARRAQALAEQRVDFLTRQAIARMRATARAEMRDQRYQEGQP